MLIDFAGYAQVQVASAASHTMNDNTPDTNARLRVRRCGWIVLGCVVFGILMGGRAEFQSVWVRSLVAGGAAAILALCISRSIKMGD